MASTGPLFGARRRARAGLFPPIIKRELRRRLGFRGARITGAIGADESAALDQISRTTVLAVRVGPALIV